MSGTFRLIGHRLRSKIKNRSNTTRTDANLGLSGESNYTGLTSGNIQEIMNQETIVGDNFLHLHEATMLAHAKLAKSDIAYATFESGGFYETPYCIVIDRKWKSVVLSIRGSLTLEDCVVDCLLDPSPLDAIGEKYGFSGAGQYCHGGVLECTNWLHEDLMRYVPSLLPAECCSILANSDSIVVIILQSPKAPNSSIVTSRRCCRISRLHVTHCWSLVGCRHWRYSVINAQEHLSELAMYLLQVRENELKLLSSI